MTAALTHDAFLGGRLHLWQPRDGYRAGVDPVLLAASVPAEAGQRVLDLGCGAGAAVLCLGARVAGLHLTGVELQGEYVDLARRNGGETLEVIEADLADLPVGLRQRQFEHVIANPPYFDRSASRAARDVGREKAVGEALPLSEWIIVAAKRLAPKGLAHFIQRAERLPTILSAMQGRLGSIEVLPLVAREGRDADRVIVRARKDGRAAFRLHAPVVMHRGPIHGADAPDYSPIIQDVLRGGAALIF